jgi:GTPase SAR1 family protein
MYYRGANAALLMYDITNRATFDDVRGWLEGNEANLLLSSPLWASLLIIPPL